MRCPEYIAQGNQRARERQMMERIEADERGERRTGAAKLNTRGASGGHWRRFQVINSFRRRLLKGLRRAAVHRGPWTVNVRQDLLDPIRELYEEREEESPDEAGVRGPPQERGHHHARGPAFQTTPRRPAFAMNRYATTSASSAKRCLKGKQLGRDSCPLHVVHPPTGEEFALGWRRGGRTPPVILLVTVQDSLRGAYLIFLRVLVSSMDPTQKSAPATQCPVYAGSTSF
ncbi:unnamed protein product [Gadus morhua 'NCC']